MIMYNFTEISFVLELLQHKGTTLRQYILKLYIITSLSWSKKQLLLVFRTSNKEINSFNKSEAQFFHILITH